MKIKTKIVLKFEGDVRVFPYTVVPAKELFDFTSTYIIYRVLCKILPFFNFREGFRTF